LDQHGGAQRFLPRIVPVAAIPDDSNDDQRRCNYRHGPLNHLAAVFGDEFDAVLDFQSELVAL